jgi:hypothetical protein
MTFSVSTDKKVRRNTVIGLILFSVLPLSSLFRDDHPWISLVLISLFVLAILEMYLIKPLQYQLDDSTLTMRRPFKDKVIDLKDIRRVDRIEYDILDGAIGGIFGYYGVFSTELGDITFHATRRGNMVMLTKHDDSKIILTPDQPDEFMNELEKGIEELSWAASLQPSL